MVFKHFPLNMHKFARPAAEAAAAAQRQGKFWPYHDLLFKNYNKLNAELIESLAVEAGLNMAQFNADRNDPSIKAQVQKDYNDAIQAGVRGTPTFFVNGVLVKDRTLNGFQQLIDQALEKVAKKN